MRLKFPALLFIILFSCTTKESNQNLEDEIISLQTAKNGLDSILQFSNLRKASEIIIKNNDIKDSLKAENNFLLGSYFRTKGKLDSAAIYFHAATQLVDTITNIRQTKYFRQTIDTYWAQGKYGDATAVNELFFNYLSETKNNLWLSLYYYHTSLISASEGDYETALFNNKKRIELLKISKSNLELVPALLSQALYIYRVSKDKEIPYKLFDSIIKGDSILTYDLKRQVYGNYGVYNYYDGNYESAIKNYLIGLKNVHQINNANDKNDLLATSYANISEAYIEISNYELAKKYLDSIELLGIENIDTKYQKSFLKYKARLAFKTSKNPEDALKYVDTIFKYRDKSYAEKYNQELVSLKIAIKGEALLKESKQAEEVKNLKLQNRILFLIFFIILLSLLGYTFQRRKKIAFKKQNLFMQQRLLRSQMNPHFMYNTLYAIQKTIKKDQNAAVSYLNKFSRLLRLILENSTHNFVLLNKEIECLQEYLELKLMRASTSFTYDISFINLNKDDLIFIPPMLIQPFIENSLEHGFKNIDYTGDIKIELSKKDEFISCKIVDNGKGLSDPKLTIKNSISIKLIKEYIYNATKQKLLIINNPAANTQGVVITFLIPYKLTENDESHYHR